MGSGNGCGNRVGRIIYRRVFEREEPLPRSSNAHVPGRSSKHTECRNPVVRTVHVRLRDRLTAAAGGDHWSGGDGEEEDLVPSALYLVPSKKPRVDMESLLHITTLHYL